MNKNAMKDAMDNLSGLLDYETEQKTSYWIIVSSISDDGWANISADEDKEIHKNDLILVFSPVDKLCPGISCIDLIELPRIRISMKQLFENAISLEAVRLNSTLSTECKNNISKLGEI